MIVAILGLLYTLLLPTASALLLATILDFTGLLAHASTAGLIIALPALYAAWLLIFLGLSALETQVLMRLFPKRRRIECKPGDVQTGLTLLGVFLSYTRLTFVESLPLIKTFQSIDALRNLVFLSYSVKIDLGHPVHLGTALLYDPDITRVGDDAVLGAHTAIVAHSMTVSPGGELVYVSAPVTIGARATVGGECRIAMGVTIGADAVIEPGSNVAAFTTIEPGEVWGGNPAQLRRRRSDTASTAVVPVSPSAEFSSLPDGLASEFRPFNMAPRVAPSDVLDTSAFDTDLVDTVRRSVAQALNLSLEEVPADLHSSSRPEWDSLGQIAIAATLADSLGWRPSPVQLFAMRSIPEIVAMIDPARTNPAPSIVAGTLPTTDVKPPISKRASTAAELLPLLPLDQATAELARRADTDFPGYRAVTRVVIAANFTANPLVSSLKLWSRAFGIRADVEFADYNQIDMTLRAPESLFRDNPLGINVVIISPAELPIEDESALRERLDHWLNAIDDYRRQAPGSAPLLVSTIPPAVGAGGGTNRAAFELARAQWHSRLRATPGVELLDFAAMIEEVGVVQAWDAEWETITRAPYSARVYQLLGQGIARVVRARRTPAAKVLALDCDGVLWGGVLGEDGMTGIKIAADGPERAFILFQQQIRRLKEQGVLLVLVSRNEEADVWEVFDRHPGMILARQDIAAWRINWKPKFENLRELADELNLGLDAFVFIDDDPANRMQVALELPQVVVPDWPENPVHFASQLCRLWAFDGAANTDEDRKRTEMIHQERQRHDLHTATPNVEEYLRQLDVRVDIREATDADMPRVAQLTQKTNQFNLSLKRRTTEELTPLADDARVLAIRARDRFGDYGLIGVAILAIEAETATIDTFLLSCRAMGRGVEQAFLHELGEIARSAGCETLVAPFVEGPRNRPAREFFASAGFVELVPNEFRRAIGQPMSRPEHVTCIVSEAR